MRLMVKSNVNPFIENKLSQEWLNQFLRSDRAIAENILSKIVFISADKFIENMVGILSDRLEKTQGPVAYFVESERRHRDGIPHRLFKDEPSEKSKRRRRVVGRTGPPLIPRLRNVDQEVGSEGVIASLLTQFWRNNKGRVYLSPGPDTFREKRIRHIVFVTDFMGSGDRMWKNIESAWRVRSVRSWWSRRSRAGLSFEIIAYSATTSALARLCEHPSQPKITIVQPCPTIDSSFDIKNKNKIYELCSKYNEKNKFPLGYGNIGALIAFSHSVPNNVPPIFWNKRENWNPLFPGRVTSAGMTPFNSALSEMSDIFRLKEFLGPRAMAGPMPFEYVVLVALQQTKHAFALSEKLGEPLSRVNSALLFLLKKRWIDGRAHITDRGRVVISRQSRINLTIPLPSHDQGLYYPTSLRVPRDI